MSGLTFTDMFCGAGGSSIGAEMAGLELRLGLNHWERAIETHSTNFPNADHDCEDVSSLTTARIRSYPDSDILLASPECTNHSLAKGGLRRKPQAPSLFDDGPAGGDEQDRSRATMWDVVRFAEQKVLKGKPYKAIIVENVVDAYRWGYNDDGGLFQAWCQAMKALGYESETVYLNSMFAPPTPQSRDRMYVVFWQRGIRRPNLRVTPPCWCPECEGIVDGQQTFKKPELRWGRYGVQYVYRCPKCTGVAFPGVFPAATAIDFTLPAEVIGDRKRPLATATRERIKRGILKLANEPFAFRLLQSGNPKPLTLPFVTLTRRHDLGLVLPVAGNTFERTPGNRMRDSRVQPMDTVHGTLDRALVMANTENGVPRDAEKAASQTLRTEGGLAVVMANRAHGVPRHADRDAAQTATTAHGGGLGVVQMQNHGEVTLPEEPLHTVRSGGQHHGVVVSNYGPGGGRKKGTPQSAGGWVRDVDLSPFGSITVQDGHSLVVPYGSAAHSDQEPARTLTTRDRVALLVPPSAEGRVRDANTEPSSTQTTTTRPAIVEVTDDDIDACRFRMFELEEIARTMAMDLHPLGGEYVVVGNKRERMAQYGNAVTPPAMMLLASRVAEAIDSGALADAA